MVPLSELEKEGKDVPGLRREAGEVQKEFWGHLVLSHHMANCEAASRKRVLFQLKRRTDSVADLEMSALSPQGEL